ncbi:MAG: DUF445 family protein [Campylobacterales bacterium]|nr:DUF445 family protein [Campylobacterales bacterium]
MSLSKSTLTNVVSLLLIGSSYIVPQTYHSALLYTGLFALSGALTNQIAIHMLFEKVPGLYGSGVIEKNFETFKTAIRTLVMNQFFTKEKIDAFFQKEDQKLDLAPLVESADFSPAFDALLATLMESKFGGMISMFGGQSTLETLREPFSNKLKKAVSSIVDSDLFKTQLHQHLQHSSLSDDFMSAIEKIVTQRLNELTPQMVKELIQKLIHEHLGWLVLWGGVFGGLIGLVSSLVL